MIPGGTTTNPPEAAIRRGFHGSRMVGGGDGMRQMQADHAQPTLGQASHDVK